MVATLHPDRLMVHELWQAAAQDNRSFLLRCYERMALIRAFEANALELTRGSAPRIAGSIHLCAGQEAIPVGAMAALEAGDRIVGTYRGHGWLLECGVDPELLLAEMCHRAAGLNGGRCGSAYALAPQYGMMGENSIVGAGGPIACGLALAGLLHEPRRVTVVSFGDGATSQGGLHESLVFAAARALPILFLCENNGWAELTPASAIIKAGRIAERARGYGMRGITVDGANPLHVRDTIAQAAEYARSGNGPVLIECRTPRLWGHYHADMEHYRSREDRLEHESRDPLACLRAKLLNEDMADEAELNSLLSAAESRMQAITERISAMPAPDPAEARRHNFAFSPSAPTPEEGELRRMTYAAAVNLALADAMERDGRIIVYGEDVAKPGGVFGVTRDLQKRFGEKRVFDTPIAETAILGSAVGAAMDGMRPVVEIMWSDFLLVALDPLINQAANVRYISQGKLNAPMIVRTQQGATPGSCAQHSQSLEAILAHIPGLIVGLPANPNDAFQMLRTALSSEDPVILFESRAIYREEGEVRVDAPVEPVGMAKIARPGSDIGIISWGRMVHRALEAAEKLALESIQASVLDLRWLSPMDDAAVAALVKQCGGRIMVVHEANRTGGFGAEVAARITERHFKELAEPVKRIGLPDTRVPASPVLQNALLPNAEMIFMAAKALAGS